ncbi:MAG: hypothetical protein ACOY46_13945 [Bacillota bacterium]
MKQAKLYNVIFPIWFLLFFPPVILLTLAGNFIIDSLVILVCFFVFKLADAQNNIKTFYKENILKVWMFGFLADILGAAVLFITGILGDSFGLSYKLISAINYDPFSHRWAVVIIIFAMLVSALFIFLFNYRIIFRDQILEKQLRLKLALTIAIITMPWTFLLPTKWFY